jgi:hypothetical protein
MTPTTTTTTPATPAPGTVVPLLSLEPNRSPARGGIGEVQPILSPVPSRSALQSRGLRRAGVAPAEGVRDG